MSVEQSNLYILIVVLLNHYEMRAASAALSFSNLNK